MRVLYVARSAKLSKWASDVGLGKHVYRLGCADEPIKPLIEAGWAGETDWVLVKKEAVEGMDEAAAIARLNAKEKMIDPNLYPKIKGAQGIFRLTLERVENHILLTSALAGEHPTGALKLKPADFAAYLIQQARG